MRPDAPIDGARKSVGSVRFAPDDRSGNWVRTDWLLIRRGIRKIRLWEDVSGRLMKQGAKMRDRLGKVGVAVLVVLVLLAGGLGAGGAWAQEKKAPQTAGVDDTKMGPYRALAQLAYAAMQKGDKETAAKLTRILERTWDKAEDYGGDTALSKTNHALFEQIDKAMDTFISLVQKAGATPDMNAIKNAYTAYLDKLKTAD